VFVFAPRATLGAAAIVLLNPEKTATTL